MAPAPAAPAPAATPASESPIVEVAAGVDPALVPVPIPETVPEIVTQLRTRTEQIRVLIDKGSFGSVYVPAFQAKDLALALEAKKDALSPEKQKVAIPAIAQLVRSAYLLDAFGDLGNKQQISDAFELFSAAAKDIDASFAGK